MAVALEIAYRGVERSQVLDRLIAQEAINLEQCCGPILRLRVVVVRNARHYLEYGTPFQVHIALSVPGEDLFMQMAAHEDAAYNDAGYAVHAAFSKARRALDYSSAPSRAAI